MPHPIPSRRRTRKSGATWRHFYQTEDGRFAHPGAPDSSGAPGSPHAADAFLFGGIPHPDSPAADHQTHDRLFHLDILERAECVCEAIWTAPDYVGEFVIAETGRDLKGLYEGLVPMMALSLGVVAATTAIGGAGGALIGALAGGPFALATGLEGGAEGGAAGFAAGMEILEAIGVGFLIVYVGDNLDQSTNLASEGVVIAWKAPDSPLENAEIDRGAHKLADAVAVLIKLVLMGMVMFLLAKGTEAAASRVSELAGKLRASRFGRPLGDWVEANWKSLIEDSRLRRKEAPPSSGGASEGGTAQSGSLKPRQAAPAKKDGAPHNQDWKKIEQDIKNQFTAQRREGSVDMNRLSDADAATYYWLEDMGRGGERAKTILNSGTDFTAKPLKENEPLYAFESSDGTKNANSPFWLDKEGFKEVQDKFYKDGQWDRQGVKGYLALPCANRADSIVEAKVTKPQTALQSTIGPATENFSYVGADGQIQQQNLSMLGGGKQITPAVGTVQLVTP